MSQDNIIYIGNKPIMNYVLACLTLLHGGSSEVQMKARGRAISTAVDVAEVLRNRFMPDMAVKSVDIGTESVTSQDGNKRNVSTISIKLSKPAVSNNKKAAAAAKDA
jgi:archaea-specific DNA-binding protein